jgi:outer membrane putative beta-barrel porin/alpha-amylase
MRSIILSSRGPALRRGLHGLLGFLSLFTVYPPEARCGAPFQTDDPNVVATGHVELLAFHQSTLTAAGRNGSLIGLESHFGIRENTELDVVLPLAFATPYGSPKARGYGDTVVGLKYRLLQVSDMSPMVSLVPKLTLPTGDSSRGLGNGGSQLFLAVAAEWRSDRFLTYGNAGYWINNGPGNRDYAFAGWQAQYQLSDRWSFGGEVFHTTSQFAGQPASTGFNVGGYCTLDPRNQLLFSAGRGLQNAAATNRASVYAGYQLSF